MAHYDGLFGSWMPAWSGNLLAQIVGVAPGFDRLGSSQRVGSVSPRFYRTASSTAPRVDVDPEFRVFDYPTVHAPKRRHDRAVLGEALFRSALSRERKRADRFDEFFALVTIAVGQQVAGAVTDALDVATRETDLVGWLEQDRIIGVILAQVASPSEAIARQIEARLQRELGPRLGARAIEELDICWYVHAGPGAHGAVGLSEGDPLLNDIRTADRRRTLLDAGKRALDIVGSLALLLLLLPVFLVAAALVKLTSPGPVLFKQVRVGQLAKPFGMLKFRTMYVNNDSAVHQQFVADFIKSSAAKKQSGEETFFKIKNDPRVTRVGHILRKTSLDELPQLWNVFRGDMSLVGPRPPLRYELEQYRPWHWRRVLEAKPGVTGLWQVMGRSRTTFDEMVRLDLRYVKTRNLWTDVRILFATPRAVITGKGAC